MENNITVNMENLSESEREQLMKLIEKANNVENKAWEPKDGEIYYFILCNGNIDYTRWNDTETDNNMYSIGNWFHTKEEAEFAVEKLKVIAEMKRIAAKDDEVEWNRRNMHYCIYFDYGYNQIAYGHVIFIKYPIVYFASEERAEEAVKTIGEDRLKKYLFGLEVE